MLKKIEKANKKKGGDPATEGYIEMQIMDLYSLSPFEIARLHRWDRKLLYYYQILKGFNEQEAFDDMKHRDEAQAKLIHDLPKQETQCRKR